MSLKNKKIIVTAGCSGLGQIFTMFLLQQGAIVIPTTRDASKAKGFKDNMGEELKKNCYPEVLAFKNHEDNSNFINRIKKNHDFIYGLVNTAVCRNNVQNPLEECIETWKEHYEINVFLTTNLTLQIANALMKNGGSIINISSFYSKTVPDNRIYDQNTIPTSLIYASSKAALNYITEYLAVMFAKQNIRVNAILPGGIRNPAIQSEYFLENYKYRTPMNRMAFSDEFNAALYFLLSPENQFCTGQLISIDGGWSLI